MNVQIARELKILILEDTATDAELIERVLQKAGLRFRCTVATSKDVFLRALSEFSPDIVLSDCDLPDMSGLDALRLVQAVCPGVPVIELTGGLSDEAAVALIRAGATDYVLKDRLARLPFAVEQALAAAEDVRLRKQSERALRLNDETYRNLVETSGDWIWEIDESGTFKYVNRRVKFLYGYEPEKLIGKSAASVLPLGEAFRIGRIFQTWSHSRDPHEPVEHDILSRGGEALSAETTVVPTVRDDGSFSGYRGVTRDLTERNRVQEALRESESKFRGLVEQGIAGIYMLSAEGNVVYVNPAFAQMFGYDAGTIIGRPFTDFLADNGKSEAIQEFALQFSGRQPFARVTASLKRANGDVADVLAESALTTYKGKPASIGVIVDITEQTQSERKLRASEERFRQLVEMAPEAILVFDIESARFVQANRQAEELFGCSRDVLLKFGPTHFYCPLQSDGITVEVSYEDHNERALKGELVKFERRIRGANGCEADCAVTLVRLASAGAQLLRASFVDITEQKAAEKKVSESELRLRTVMDTVADGIVLVDADTRTLVQANKAFCEMLGYRADDLVGLNLDKLHPRESLDRVQAEFERQLRGDPTGATDIPTKRKDGSVFFADVTGSPVIVSGRNYMVAAFHDVSERRHTGQLLEQLNRTLRTLSSANAALVRAQTEQDLLDGMCKVVVEIGGYAFAWVAFAKLDAAKSVRPAAWAGNDSTYLEDVDITWSDSERGRGPTGTAIRTGATQVQRDFETNSSLAPWRAAALKHKFQSTAAFPLKNGTDVMGTLTLYSAERNSFDAQDCNLLEELATDLSYGILALRDRTERARAANRTREALAATVTALASTVEMRDAYTAGHQHRVSDIACAIARELKRPEDEIQGIYLAGVIHDIGKIQVPSEILSKPGKLTPLEYELIKCHAKAGYEIVKGIDFPWPVANIILQHHERLDGSGYPQGLKDDAILFDAKILAVADVVEAMMSHRPYRAALGIDAALCEIEQGKARLYDSTVVDACVRLFRTKSFAVS